VVREKQVVKAAARRVLVDRMKADLGYAEVAVRKRPEQLTQIGWGIRRPGTKLTSPGEVRDIAIKAEGDTWIVLEWKPPVDGGGVAAYVVERRPSDGGRFEHIATVVETEHRAMDQPRGVELDYRVVALNKAGAGAASGLVTAVL
jgi:Fibronectin type III domain